jgi:hypothetical protein
VSFGLSRVLVDLKMAKAPRNYLVLVGAMILDFYLLYVFFSRRSRLAAAAPEPPPDDPPPGTPAVNGTG